MTPYTHTTPIGILHTPSPTPHLQLYPNPAVGSVTVNCADLQGEEVKKALLMDVYGRCYEANLLHAGENMYTIDLGGYPVGTYLLSLISERGSRYTAKLVVATF